MANNDVIKSGYVHKMSQKDLGYKRKSAKGNFIL